MIHKPRSRRSSRPTRNSAHRRAHIRFTRIEWLEDRCYLSGVSLTGLPSSFTLASGAPLPFALQATDTANPSDALSYTVTSSNPSLMTPIIPIGQSIQIKTSAGNMTFELFTSLAPKTTQQFINLINNANQPLNTQGTNADAFYRIAQGFMMQFGPYDPSISVSAGNGPSPSPATSGIASFANEYNPDLRFTTSGILAMANTGAADSDGTQFFVTDVAAQNPYSDLGFLDFNYSIFGIMTSGQSVQQAIMQKGVAFDSSTGGYAGNGFLASSGYVTINSISLTPDTQHSAVLFAGAQGQTGSGTVTITVSDQHGNTGQETIPFSTAPNADYPAASVTMPAPTGIAVVGTTPASVGSPNGSQQYQVSGVQANATVTLYADGNATPVGTATASSSGGTVDITGSLSPGNHVFSAVQESSNEQSPGTNTNDSTGTPQPDITGNLASPSFDTTISVPDTTAPAFASNPYATAALGDTYTYTVSTNKGAGDPVTYELVGAPTGMTINASGGQIVWPGADVTTLGQTNPITLYATDSFGNQGVTSFQLNVVDPSTLTAPTGINLTLANSSGVQQASPVGTAVGTLAGVDANTGDQLTYSLVTGSGSTDNASFSISGNQLLTAASPLSQTSYSVRVRVTDSSGLTDDQVFTVNTINDTPTGINLNYANSGGLPAHATSGTLVGTFSSVEPDPNDTNTYSFVSGPGGADNASFTIVGNQLFTNIDQLTNWNYSIQVQTTDSAGLSFVQDIAIPVVDQPPTSITLSNNSIPQNALLGTVVGTLGAVDTGPASGTAAAPGPYSFRLVSGTGDTDNGSFVIQNGQLLTNFDAPQKPTYNILVSVTDSGGASASYPLSINVTPVYPPPTGIALSATTFQDGQPIGTPLATFTTSAPQTGDTYSYALVSGTGSADDASFTIVGNQLEPAKVLNAHTQSTYQILVQSSDPAGQSVTQAFVIQLQPSPTPPTPTPPTTTLPVTLVGDALANVAAANRLFSTNTLPPPAAVAPLTPATPAPTAANLQSTPIVVSSVLGYDGMFGERLDPSTGAAEPVIPAIPPEPPLDQGDGKNPSPQSSRRDETDDQPQRLGWLETDQRATFAGDPAAEEIDARAIDAAMDDYAGEEVLVEDLLG
jgi:cyclophilin family peptidyl-prolyl cis-trans isomerase